VVTILVAPLMSCSARLPVYALMIAVLIPGGSISVLAKVGMLIGLYALGTGTAFFMAWLFKRTLMKGETPFLIMELPPYRRPVVRTVLINMFNRAKDFLKNAGTVILGISIILWALAAYPKAKSPEVTPAEQLRQSYAGRVGHFIEPAIKPLGYDWKVGIGLVASFAAREVFVSTMSIVYSVEEGDDNTSTLREAMQKDTWPDGRPVYTPLVGVSVLVFYVLAMQCMSTLAVVRRETNSWRWPAFQFAYMTGLAYVVALLVYQGGRALGF
jgi:ferrous iron transport protein B